MSRDTDALAMADQIIAYIDQHDLDQDEALDFAEEVGNAVEQHVLNYVRESA